jgi:ubiquinone/menaquinone biosynthesis C-methylase UbiE
MLSTVPFDYIATEYDEVFSKSLIGTYQRAVTRQHLSKLIDGKKNLKILEINCGTGEDALWLAARGHRVIATDQSERMISIAQQKVHENNNLELEFVVCCFDELDVRFEPQQFDLIFSNFSGLNCVSERELFEASARFNSLLNKDGYLAAVIFGNHCVWESVYYLLKRNIGAASRRWSNKKVLAKLANNIYQPTYYYSVEKFKQLLPQFKQEKKRPVGLFIPPSYLESYFKKKVQLFNVLVKLEKTIGSIGALSSFADHVYILLKKKRE